MGVSWICAETELHRTSVCVCSFTNSGNEQHSWASANVRFHKNAQFRSLHSTTMFNWKVGGQENRMFGRCWRRWWYHTCTTHSIYIILSRDNRLSRSPNSIQIRNGGDNRVKKIFWQTGTFFGQKFTEILARVSALNTLFHVCVHRHVEGLSKLRALWTLNFAKISKVDVRVTVHRPAGARRRVAKHRRCTQCAD